MGVLDPDPGWQIITDPQHRFRQFNFCVQEQKSAATGQVLVNLPDKKVETHTIKLSPEEQKVYDKVHDAWYMKIRVEDPR